MTQVRYNKPKVFLSHSKADLPFIERLHDDLRLCQIDPWLDSVEIRHGQPWLDAIFESGIPTCDAVLVYLTEASVQSPMVKKEIDAGIIKKLCDNHLALLPYVSDSALRDSLRADIQALQTPEWNEGNYAELLPQVVAEIWHSYLDRVVLSVANAEKARRLEAELELERLKKTGEAGVFDGREIADFEYIWAQLDRYEPVEYALVRGEGDKGKPIRRYRFRVHLQGLVVNLDKIMFYSEYQWHRVSSYLRDILAEGLPRNEELEKDTHLRCTREPNLIRELLMYGLVQQAQKTVGRSAGVADGAFRMETERYYVFTEKMYRFKYWLAHHGWLSDELRWESGGDSAEPEE